MSIEYSLDTFSQLEDSSISISPTDYLFDLPVNHTMSILFKNKDVLNLDWTSRLITPDMLAYNVVYEFDTVADMIHIRNATLQSMVTGIEFKQTMSIINTGSNEKTFLANVTITNGFNEFTDIVTPRISGVSHVLLIDDIHVRLSASDTFVALYEDDLPKRIEYHNI